MSTCHSCGAVNHTLNWCGCKIYRHVRCNCIQKCTACEQRKSLSSPEFDKRPDAVVEADVTTACHGCDKRTQGTWCGCRRTLNLRCNCIQMCGECVKQRSIGNKLPKDAVGFTGGDNLGLGYESGWLR